MIYFFKISVCYVLVMLACCSQYSVLQCILQRSPQNPAAKILHCSNFKINFKTLDFFLEAGKNCLGFISEQGSGTTDKADQGKQSFRRRCCAAVKRGHPSGVPVFRTHTLDFPGHSTVFVGETQQEMWYSVFSKGQNAGMQKQELNLLNRFILLGKTHPAEHHGMLQLIFGLLPQRRSGIKTN